VRNRLARKKSSFDASAFYALIVRVVVCKIVRPSARYVHQLEVNRCDAYMKRMRAAVEDHTPIKKAKKLVLTSQVECIAFLPEPMILSACSLKHYDQIAYSEWRW
jgi:hypothetical protein